MLRSPVIECFGLFDNAYCIGQVFKRYFFVQITIEFQYLSEQKPGQSRELVEF
jgi:hypothetical protein